LHGPVAHEQVVLTRRVERLGEQQAALQVIDVVVDTRRQTERGRDEPGRAIAVLDALSNVGVGLSIDDFGTGYSSLSYLKRLPIEEIKVDRSFVMQMHVDANDFMIVRATVDLGRNLGLRVVAEGVEDLATFDRLADFGCDEAQGYYISKPLSAIEFTRWLSVRNLDRESGEIAQPDDRRTPDRGLHAI